jgi:Domain of unknown function (DUF4116)
MKSDIARAFANGTDIFLDAASNEFKLATGLDATVASVAKKVFKDHLEVSVEDRFLHEIERGVQGGARSWMIFSQKLIERLETLDNPKAKETIKKIKEAQKIYTDQNVSLSGKCPDFLVKNRDYIRSAIIEEPSSICFIPDDLYKDDEELFLLAIKKFDFEDYRNPFEKLNPEKLKDREFAKKACALNGLALKYFTDFQNDKDIALIALKQNGNAYRFLTQFHFFSTPEDKDKLIRYQKDIICLALSSNGKAIDAMDHDICFDKVYIALACKTAPNILEFGGRKLSREIMLASVASNARCLSRCRDEFFTDPIFQKAAYRQDPKWTLWYLNSKGFSSDALKALEEDSIAPFEIKPRLIKETTTYRNEDIKNTLLSALFEIEDKKTHVLIPDITSNSQIAPALSSMIFLSLLPQATSAKDLEERQVSLNELLPFIHTNQVDLKDAQKLKNLLVFLTSVKKLRCEDHEKLQIIKKFLNKDLPLKDALEMMSLFPLTLEHPGLDSLLKMDSLTKKSLLGLITKNLVNQGFLDPELTDKFVVKFLSSRMPSGIFSYCSNFTHDPIMKAEINHFISLVCNDALEDWRLGANAHSKFMTVPQQHKWNTALPKKEIHQASFQNLEFSPHEFISLKVISLAQKEGLLDLEKLCSRLRGSTLELPPIEAKIFHFSKCRFEERDAIIDEIIADLKTSHPASALIAAFENLKKTKPFIVTDSENWQDLFFSGSEVMGSCQNVVGNPSLNKCLLGYVLDGKTRVLCVKETEEGPIKARALVKVFIQNKIDPASGETKEVPCLLIEKTYPTVTPFIQKQLVDVAKAKAAAMGVDLYEAAHDGVTLYSKGVNAPYEYEDGALNAGPEGHRTNGVYDIFGKKIS